MKIVKDNRKLMKDHNLTIPRKFKNLEDTNEVKDLNDDNEFTIYGEYDLKEEEANIEELINESESIDQSESIKSTNQSESDTKLIESMPNAGFPPLRLKKNNNNINNKERFYQSNINTSIRNILLNNQKIPIKTINNDTELEIIHSL